MLVSLNIIIISFSILCFLKFLYGRCNLEQMKIEQIEHVLSDYMVDK